jgi:hypothetical protein
MSLSRCCLSEVSATTTTAGLTQLMRVLIFNPTSTPALEELQQHLRLDDVELHPAAVERLRLMVEQPLKNGAGGATHGGWLIAHVSRVGFHQLAASLVGGGAHIYHLTPPQPPPTRAGLYQPPQPGPGLGRLLELPGQGTPD